MAGAGRCFLSRKQAMKSVCLEERGRFLLFFKHLSFALAMFAISIAPTFAGSAGAQGAQRMQVYSANLLNQYTNRTVPGFIEGNVSADVAASITINGAAASRHGE